MEANAKRSKPLIMKPGGIYLSIEPTFVFHKKSRNMKILLRRCFVEQAVFAVPLIPMTVAIRDEPFDTEYLFEADNNIRPSERYVSTETIRVGYTVVVTAVETGQVVVEAKVLDLDLLENGLYRKIVVKSTENKKCDEIRLAYFPSEGVWRVLSEDPFGPGETFSRRSNGYYIQVSHREDWDQMKSEVDGLIKRLSQKPLALKLGGCAEI
jgi:hypothetical protein